MTRSPQHNKCKGHALQHLGDKDKETQYHSLHHTAHTAHRTFSLELVCQSLCDVHVVIAIGEGHSRHLHQLRPAPPESVFLLLALYMCMDRGIGTCGYRGTWVGIAERGWLCMCMFLCQWSYDIVDEDASTRSKHL